VPAPKETPLSWSTTWPDELTDAVGHFVVARRPFLTELAGIGRRRTLDPAHLASLYEDASAVLDRLLLRFIAAHQAASA